MTTLQQTYSTGDWIVHAYYGVGQVKGKDDKSLGGEKQSFFKVKTFNGVYWLPVKKADVDHIRPLASKMQISRALSLIRKAPQDLPSDYKLRGREILEAIRNVSLYAKARMIRDLNGKKFTSKLNISDQDALDKMKMQFLNEWAVVKEEDRGELEKKLKQALHTSIEKAPVVES
jgi:RNA polymerase-interacting CarD/CdnL/TRCF family regulator